MTDDLARTSIVGEWLAGRRPAPRIAPAAHPEDLVMASADELGQLRAALESNRRIGMAMGVIMGQLQVSEEEAFDVLRRISQNTNRKLRAVAEDVVHHRCL